MTITVDDTDWMGKQQGSRRSPLDINARNANIVPVDHKAFLPPPQDFVLREAEEEDVGKYLSICIWSRRRIISGDPHRYCPQSFLQLRGAPAVDDKAMEVEEIEGN